MGTTPAEPSDDELDESELSLVSGGLTVWKMCGTCGSPVYADPTHLHRCGGHG